MLKAREDRPGAAVGLILVTFLFFTGIDVAAKWLTTAGMAVLTTVFFRYFLHFLLTLGAAAATGEGQVWRMNRPWLTLIRGSMLGVGTACNFLAIQYIPLTVTVSIYFTVPLMVTAAAALFLGEKVGPRRWAAIAVGLVGVLVITQPWGARFHWAMGVSLVAVVVTTVYVLLTRRLAGEERPDTMQFWAALLPVIVFAPFAVLNWSLPETPTDWVFFALLGACGWAGHQCWVLAYRFAEASALAPYSYVQIVYMAAAGWLVFGQQIDAATMAGALILILSGLYVWARERAVAGRPPP